MRFRHLDGSTVHLAYCTNVHPAETLDGVLAQLRNHCEPVRRRLGRDRLGIGLWLARDAARALSADSSALRRLRRELDTRGLEVVTLNGFPYQGFGDHHVKYRVYRPDWTEPARLDHTVTLARLLTALLPDDAAEGTISTLPLAWRTDFDPSRDAAARQDTALTALRTLTAHLDALHERTGRSIRVGLEPEPGCVIETVDDAIAPLTLLTTPTATPPLTHPTPTRPTPTHPTPTHSTSIHPTTPTPRIGVCLDTCHLATSFEDPRTALHALHRAAVPVVKAQLSVALHAEHPHRTDVRAALSAFVEPRFLHQTRTRTPQGTLLATDDLNEALSATPPLPPSPPPPDASTGGLPRTTPWRAHFHIPLHTPPEPPLTSTLTVLREALALLVGGPAALTHHLEVETYTWQALPPALRPRTPGRLADGIAAELSLARDLLTDLGLRELL
ncbi:metabolite traffic protein EboE [Streptomyces sp. MST-110588]|uniref:metabolite traffic protein EboE n=1 Tax=Streptomyces sp. MST-110588 TaxID=2833628 RepID=UPI001F5DF2BE|nr:metabolite traffic protein EboE [Streptomyces sp. MST-110588]UNO42976.1 metabolite traffic protein EboE [Streptomyces sp. MST-110588]